MLKGGYIKGWEKENFSDFRSKKNYLFTYLFLKLEGFSLVIFLKVRLK